jgi:transcriptional regulator with PAS, ATPase and Fis domain
VDGKRINIRLYILVPAIFSGITIINIIVSYRIISYYLALKREPALLITWWGIAIVCFTFVCSYLVLWVILSPVTRFVKNTENLPVFQNVSVDDKVPKARDDLQHFSKVFNEVTDILSKVEAKELFPDIIGHGKAMRGIFSQILKVAPTDSTVLISGESGTGKELVATSIYEHSLRKGRPFVKLNCVAIPEGLLESELFGHEKGAFTGATSQKKGKFELANGGTIFLDEIGDMPLPTQAKLLRVLQEKEFERVGGNHSIKVDVRFIAATNKHLLEMVKSGTFREDLYYRINVFSIYLPPLRERTEDIPMLAEYFLEKSTKPAQFSPQVLQILMGYAWPGNVRELQNAIERAAVLSEDGMVSPVHFPSQYSSLGFTGQVFRETSESASIDDRLNDIEKSIIMEVLTRTGGVQVKAAQLLGINQRSLWHRIKKYNIDVETFKNLT